MVSHGIGIVCAWLDMQASAQYCCTAPGTCWVTSDEAGIVCVVQLQASRGTLLHGWCETKATSCQEEGCGDHKNLHAVTHFETLLLGVCAGDTGTGHSSPG